jgi:hypothetical protein
MSSRRNISTSSIAHETNPMFGKTSTSSGRGPKRPKRPAPSGSSSAESSSCLDPKTGKKRSAAVAKAPEPKIQKIGIKSKFADYF